MTTNVFSKGDVLELLMTKFILPTVDVCTDILTIEEILTYDRAGLDSSTILDVLISSTVYAKYCQHFLAMLKYINSFQYKIGIIFSMLSYTNGLCKVSKTDVKSCLVSTTLWEDLIVDKLPCKNLSTVIKVMLRLINIHDKIHTYMVMENFNNDFKSC